VPLSPLAAGGEENSKTLSLYYTVARQEVPVFTMGVLVGKSPAKIYLATTMSRALHDERAKDVGKLVFRQPVCTVLQPECTYTCV
jgi:hypothetical protein